MKKPTKSVKLIQRQVDLARRDGVMVVIHPDTAQFLVDCARGMESVREMTKHAERRICNERA